jgi:hypothetical protein
MRNIFRFRRAITDTLNKKIALLNSLGVPVVFIVTGNNSSGKTTFTRKLIQEIRFYQSINLGLASKLIRFFKPKLDVDKLENFKDPKIAKVFDDLTDFISAHYYQTGVNTIIEGVQIDTQKFLDNESVIGGVILDVPEHVALSRGRYPETHFKRKLDRLTNIEYIQNEKFARISNERLGDTFDQVIDHLNKLVDQKIRSLRSLK